MVTVYADKSGMGTSNTNRRKGKVLWLQANSAVLIKLPKCVEMYRNEHGKIKIKRSSEKKNNSFSRDAAAVNKCTAATSMASIRNGWRGYHPAQTNITSFHPTHQLCLTHQYRTSASPWIFSSSLFKAILVTQKMLE